MSNVEPTTGEIRVPAGRNSVLDVTTDGQPDMNRSAGQRFHAGLQQMFADHKIMGSDGLAEIVTIQLTRAEARELESSLSDRLEALRQEHLQRSASA